jgi:hypothetical protein
MPSGYAATLPADVLLDSGLLLVNSAVPWGVSLGDLSFDPGKMWKQIEFDGKRSEIVGLDRIIQFDSKISGTIKEYSAAKIAQILEPGSVTTAGGGVTTITPKKAGSLFVAGDYLSNVRLAFPRGSGGYAWVKFPKAMCKKYDGIKGKDKDEASTSIEIYACLDMSVAADTDVAPYVIELAAAL